MVNDMKKKRNIRGFTMAELLIVVAIIMVLSGVGFVAVQSHRKALEQTEANTIAKEIFFAAQNHLTMAESEGYLASTVSSGFYGTPTSRLDRDNANAKDIYYFSVSGSSAFGGNTALDLMLPFGSIDDTIRLSGNYIIRYQASPARVLDVWYSKAALTPGEGFFASNTGGDGIGYYGGGVALEGGVTLNAPSIVVDNAERLTVTVDTTLVNKNGEEPILASSVGTVSVQLLITGKTSEAKAIIPLMPSANGRAAETSPKSGIYVVTLDDITKSGGNNTDGFHFAELFSGLGTGATISVQAGPEPKSSPFIPGENITVQAVAFSTDALASITYSNEVTTNSLFADLDEENGVAKISNIRHLENLDPQISGLDATKLSLSKAQQIADLVWAGTDANAFSTKIKDAKPTVYTKPENVRVYKLLEGNAGTTDESTAPGRFLPVNIDYALIYDGVYTEGTGANAVKKCHSITGVKVVGKGTGGGTEGPFTGDGGLFGSVKDTALTVQNLELIDFSINCTGNAGALAGTLGKNGGPTIQITNVLAHNSKDVTTAIASSGGSAGGLIGSMTGVTVQKCAAALVVNANKSAGGLIGEAHGSSTVKASYSAGHTTAKKENDEVKASEYGKTTPPYDVTGGTKVGGLIGDQENATVEYCYSTCSVSVTGTSETDYAGGLVGFSGKAITNSYATGLVHAESNNPKIGAFSGNNGSGTYQNCLYFEIINPTETTEGGTTTYGYLPPVYGSPTVEVAGITALDASADSYNTFCGAPATWKNAEPSTASGLIDLYSATVDNKKVAKYNLRTVEQLGATLKDNEADDTPYFVATHYGDWPAPEILVINVASSGGGSAIGF